MNDRRNNKTAAEEECGKVLEAMRRALELNSEANEDLHKANQRLRELLKEKKYPKKRAALIARRKSKK